MADVIAGRFTLLDLIARGGSGSVWRAWDAKTQSTCAAKVLRQRDSADLMRFVREKGAAFEHPHLLAPYGWGAEDEHVVLAMPLVTGGSLETLVRDRGPLSESATVVVLDQLLDALGAMHARRWIHRDVKPANVMLEATGTGRPHVRLADFGIAVHEADVRFTHVGMVNGTPGYMAPELFRLDEPAPTHDVYAAGVVALVALNGPIPLPDGAFDEDDLARYLGPASPALAAALRRMLAPDPAERFADTASVRAALPPVDLGAPLAFADGTPLEVPDVLGEPPADALPHDPDRTRRRRIEDRLAEPAVVRAAPLIAPAPVPLPPSLADPAAEPDEEPEAAGPSDREPRRVRAHGRLTVALAVVVLAGGAAAATVPRWLPDSAPSHASATPSAVQVPHVTAGRSCARDERGIVAITDEGAYVSCARQADGTYAYG